MIILHQNSKYPIGLDISDYSLKLIQLNKNGRDTINIQAISRVELEKGIIEGGVIINRIKVIEAIKTLLEKPLRGKVSSRDVVACLPETKTYLKLIEIEKSPNEISQVIESEIEKHIPLSVDDIYYDWQIIQSTREVDKVLIGACPKKIANQYIDVLKEAKLSIVGFEVEAVAISRALLKEESPKIKKGQLKDNYLIIDIGKKRTSMVVYSKNSPIFTLSLPLSGELITSHIAKSLEIDENQAEKAKIICGLDKTKAKGIIRNILSDTIDNIIEKIDESIDYFNHHFPNKGDIDNILICGGGSSIKNIDTYIEEATSIKTTKGDSLINFNNSNKNIENAFVEILKINSDFTGNSEDSKTMTITQDNRLTYTTAIGLALRNIFNPKL
ncbi:MAG: type IV pilus assembly protein PilM [Patescibacteria group bacterium]|jgi:type IV pilus assembly protein PilM|nr:type IV pilus assembly protein PilM [Patescibacteria group bacterium]